MFCGVPGSGYCGVYDYTIGLATNLRIDGSRSRVIEVDVLVNSAPEDTGPTPLKRQGIRVREIVDTWGMASLRHVLDHLSRDGGYDVVHLQYPSRGYGSRLGISVLPFLLRLRFPRLPIVVTLHEFQHVRLLRRVAALPLILLSQALIVTNEAESRYITRLLPFLTNKIRLIRLEIVWLIRLRVIRIVGPGVIRLIGFIGLGW